MKYKFYKLILAALDTFLIMFFPLCISHFLKKYGITNLNAIESLGVALLLAIMPVITRYLSLKIEREKENIGRNIIDWTSHILSGYVVYFVILNFSVSYTKSPIIIYLAIALMLIIMYLLFGEYNFSIGITSEEERIDKNRITEEVLNNKDICELLIDKEYDEAEISFNINVVRNEKGKLNINIDGIEVTKKGEIIEEDESFKESDK